MQSDTLADDAASVIESYLRERFPALRDVGPDTSLLTSGAVDSLGVLDLMTFIAERFEIELDDEDFDPENMETPARLAAHVARKRSR